MALFEKLGSLGKAAGDMVGETIEMTRLNAKLASLKRESSDAKTRLGEFYWQRYVEGNTPEDDTIEICREIANLESEITTLEDDIQRRKSQSESKSPEPTKSEGVVCGSCGEPNSAGVKFCIKCGSSLAAAESEVRFCPACGAPGEKDSLFCGKCGARF